MFNVQCSIIQPLIFNISYIANVPHPPHSTLNTLRSAVSHSRTFESHFFLEKKKRRKKILFRKIRILHVSLVSAVIIPLLLRILE